MTDKEQLRNELEEQLENARERIKILDMIEERLLRMRELAQRVIDEDITDEEIQKINRQVNHLEGQISLLERQKNASS